MFRAMVDLFRSKADVQRIAKLEAELSARSLELEEALKTLQKREDKIRRLSSAYQEAVQAKKSAEQRLSSIDAREEGTSVAFKDDDTRRRDGQRMGRLGLERLACSLSQISFSREDLLSAYFKGIPFDLPPQVQQMADKVSSETGLVVFHCPDLFTVVVVPAFPPLKDLVTIAGRFNQELMLDTLETPVLVVDAHGGESFVGVAFGGEGFKEHRILKTQVKEKHSKGGWSQKRFERLRDEDLRHHAQELSSCMEELASKYSPVLKYAVFSGDQSMLKMISQRSDLIRLERKVDRLCSRKLDDVINEVYSGVVYRGD